MSLDLTLRDLLPEKVVERAKRIKRRWIDRRLQVNFYHRLEELVRKSAEINTHFSFEEMRSHYVYEPARQTVEHPDIYVNQIRYYRVYEFFRSHYPQLFEEAVSVADIGDTSGLLLKAMGRRGLAVNINPEVVDNIRLRGIEAELGNVERLPFADKSFDYTLCFECVEHVKNPIQALSELARVTKGNVFVSIPWTTRTRIYSKDYWRHLKMRPMEQGGWNEKDPKEVDGHKFEFSTEDMKKIITHADLAYVDSFPINYFSPLGRSRRNEGSYFNFFILKPAGGTTTDSLKR